MIGRTLSHYHIVEKIGAGGMGEVYKAHDERLDRDVAVKVLPSGTLADEHARKRFRKEAQALSKLNHPNIATVHDFDTQDDADFIVMEFVEGRTLRELLSGDSLPTKTLLQLATQIAEGLAKAHSAGIVHRDLKPENLMVTSDGYVKILDFGLAKLLPQAIDFGSEEATITKELTRGGAILGTVGYMSPEQASGLTVDHLSDQFSFGLILYEMATGKNAFKRDTAAQTLAAIIEAEPEPIAKVNPKVPLHTRVIVERCLAKEPVARYESTDNLATELKSALEASPGWPLRRRILWAAAGLLLALLALAVGANLDRLWDGIPGSALSVPIESIAVLPLQNLSGDPEQEYFADGMTEALITDLAKIGALKVISRSSAMRYKATDKPAAQIAEELNVDALVEGSALRLGDNVRIMVQLIDPETEEALWAESYERDLRNIMLLQSVVAQAIAGEVEVALTPEETERLANARPVHPEAHEAYLKGLFHHNKFTVEGFKRAIEHFEEATRKDPSFAPAYVGLSIGYRSRGAWWGDMEPKVAFPLARDAAEKALRLDDSLGSAHSSLAMLKNIADWNWSAADTAFRRGIELSPNEALAHSGYGFFLRSKARFAEAMVQIEQAIALDPLRPMNLVELGLNYLATNRPDQGEAKCREALELNPKFPAAYLCLGRVYRSQGRLEEAIEALLKASAAPGPNMAELGIAYAEAGKKEEARQVIEEMKQLPKVKYLGMAGVAAALGETGQAMDWLERAYVEKDANLPNLPYGIHLGRFDSLRDDPRFQDFLRRMNYPE